MRKHRYWLVASLAITVCGCSTLGFGRKIATPEVTIADLALVDVGVFEQRYRVQLRIRNPNDFELPIRGMRFVVLINEKPFARGLASDGVDVPRLGDALLSVDVTTSTFDLVRQVTAAGGSQDFAYEIAGTLFLASRLGREVAFSHTGRLALAAGSAGERFVPFADARR